MFILCVFLCVAACSYFVERSWFGPSSFLSLIILTSYFGTRVFAPDYYISSFAMSYLAGCILLSAIGSLLGIACYSFFSSTDSYHIHKKEFVRVNGLILYSIGIVSGCMCLFFVLSSTGFNISKIFSVADINRSLSDITVSRYQSTYRVPGGFSLAAAGIVFYTMIAGAFYRGRFRLYQLLPIFLYILSNLILTVRAPIIFISSVYIFSFISMRVIEVSRGKMPNLFTPRSCFYIIFGSVSLFLLFLVVQLSRLNASSTATIYDVILHLKKWPWGSLPGFSIWFDAPFSNNNVLGYYTFTGILDNLGFADRVKGGYDIYVMLEPGESGNIYTAFRGLIEDFGLLGSFAFIFLLSILGGYAYNALRFNGLYALPIYVMVNCFMLWTFVISFYSFASHVVGGVLAVVLMPFFIKIRRVKGNP